MKTSFSISFHISILFISLGCSKDSTETNPPEIVYENATMISHNYINSDINVNWHQNSKLLFENQTYAFGGKTEIEWEENQNIFTIAISNNNDNTEITSEQITVTNGKSYSGFVYGTIGNETLMVSENDITRPQSGNVRVQFMHLYDNLAGVDIYVGGETANDKIVTNLTYGNKSDYYEFTKADIDTRIIVTNTGIAPNNGTNLINIENNDGHTVDKIYIDILAGINYNSTSKLSFFETPQD